MTIVLTGATGYIGAYVANELLNTTCDRLALLVRATSTDAARSRLWQAFQLHMTPTQFHQALNRIDLYLGDMTQPHLGLSLQNWDRLVGSTESVIHAAAILNRKSLQACHNVNVRGTLAVLKLARAAHCDHGLRRFSAISTTSVAGIRQNEVVTEADAIQWDRPDYDPYGATKKLCEHLVQELLPDVPHVIFRPSTVLGDSRLPKTTQFDTARAFALLTRVGVIPLQPDWQIDIVPADYVGQAIATLHQKAQLAHTIYHLSAGIHSPTYQQIVQCLATDTQGVSPLFLPPLRSPLTWLLQALAATPRQWGIARSATRLKVFMPYLTFNTVFDNIRITQELGTVPSPFITYAAPLHRFLVEHNCQFPYQPWPETDASYALVD
ncbi:MAG: SDR family oxidoreductase [Cyanobacteria bacterium J06639_16]